MNKKQTGISAGCASCPGELPNTLCMTDGGTCGKGCPTLTGKDILAAANREYGDPDTGSFARGASIQEAECYANRHERPYVMQPAKTRVEEICEFAARMGFARLGLVFCIGLKDEAAVVDAILKSKGFEVVSVCCKAGRTSKDMIGIEDRDKIFQGTDEAMCNPIFQAMLLNEEGTDFNVLLGLCVGHDSLFFKYARAYTTVLAVKDRVTGHNPLAAIYLHHTYYRKLISAGPSE
ncbi:MAG: DUF1847 domain-containing protein [Desulfomonilaceae bacterium]|nr:DUF1847 domain-containing protein [Desulfomonilaceae bacterium]